MYNVSAQVTDTEAKLRTKTTDTIQGWRKGGIVSINLAQTSLTNWASGGQNSVSINGLLSLYANYRRDKNVWDNSLDIGYGVLKQGDADFMKTDDKIDFLSKYGRLAAKNWYYAALFNVKTQMTAGYNYPNDSIEISKLFAPAYILISIGMDYKPNNYFSLFIAPVTSKLTLVMDETLADAGAFGVDKAEYDENGKITKHGKKSRSEFGGYIRAIYSKNDFTTEFLKNISFTTKIDLFSNYIDNPQNIDVSWETLIALKVNKFITVSITTHLLYDDDVDIAVDSDNDDINDKFGPRTQFKEALGVGFSYKF